MSEQLNIRSAPSFVLYLAGITFVYFLFSSISMLVQSTTEGTKFASQLINNAFLLGSLSAITLPEMLLLRRNLRLFGGFGIGTTVEVLKIFTTSQLIQGVSNTLFVWLSGGTLFAILISRALRTRIDQLSKTGLSRAALNALPAIFILAAFTGGSLLSTAGFGPVSQVQNPSPFNTSNIDFTIFNTPSWNALYYLQNLMDQFQAGLKNSNQIIFNITNVNPDPYNNNPHAPITYYATSSVNTYEYKNPVALSGSWFTSSNPISNSYTSGNIYSRPIPQSYSLEKQTTPPYARNNTVVTLKIDQNINYTSTSWQGTLPTVWSGSYGSYINAATVNYNNVGCSTTITCSLSENDINTLSTNFNDPQSVNLQLNNLPTGNGANSGVLSWQQNYLEPNYFVIAQSSMPISGYQNVFGSSWSAINNTYTQLPSGSELPTGYTNYASSNSSQSWSPTVYNFFQSLVKNVSLSTNSVYNIATDFTQALAPVGVGNYGTGIAPPNSPFLFDNQSWVGSFGGQAAHPDPNVDYIGWFLNRRSGIVIDFASALAILLRMAGIPTKLVTVYAFGNTSMDPAKTVMTAYYRYAWTEVLIPMRTLTGQYTYQWVIFDPLAYSISSGKSSIGTSNFKSAGLLLDPYSYNRTSTNITNIFLKDANRVGVDQKKQISTNTCAWDGIYTPLAEDNGILKATFTKNDHYGHVKVGVYTASVNYVGSTPTQIFGVPNVQVTFSIVNYNPATNQSTIVPWGPDPYSPYNYTNVYSVTVTSNSSDIAETEFIYNQSIQGTGYFSFIAVYGSKPCDAACLSGTSSSITIGARSDRVRGGIPGITSDGDTIILNPSIGSTQFTPVYVYSPMQFITNSNATQISSDILAVYTYWTKPSLASLSLHSASINPSTTLKHSTIGYLGSSISNIASKNNSAILRIVQNSQWVIYIWGPDNNQNNLNYWQNNFNNGMNISNYFFFLFSMVITAVVLTSLVENLRLIRINKNERKNAIKTDSA